MDLGLNGKHALVCASTRGLGFACAEALAREGCNVVLNGRDANNAAIAVEKLRSFASGKISVVLGDISAAATLDALREQCDTADILVNNNGGPSPGVFQNYGEPEWSHALHENMIAPLLLVRAVLPGMRARKFGRIINITSAMVTTPRPHMTLSAGARAGLTAALKGLSLDVARDNVTINNLLPERFDTDRQIYMAKQAAVRENISYDEARAKQVESIAAKRLGDPAEFGAFCAFLSSRYGGFVSGQNFHLDGGSYPALI